MTSILSVSASAVSYKYQESWTAYGYCYPNAPSSASSPAIKSVIYSTYGTYVDILSMSNSQPGSQYQTVITSVNGKMNKIVSKTLTTYVCKPKYEGAIPCATFKISAVSLTNGNTYTAKGLLRTKTTKD